MMKRDRLRPWVLGLVALTIYLAVIGVASETFAQDPPELYWGVSGPWVSDVQARLRNWGYYDGPVDAYYGAGTYRAVRLFQARNGLRVDGLVGPETYRALGIWVPYTTRGAAAGTATAPATYSPRSKDLDLLARLIHGEARGEPYEGQVAVAAVILNRVRSPHFPNTLSGVVYEPLAFESVQIGAIYSPPSSENVRAAQDALNGWDPTYGSLYFWAYKKTVNPWVWSRSIVRYIGNHVFAR